MSHHNDLGYDIKAKPMTILLMHTISVLLYNTIIVLSMVQFSDEIDRFLLFVDKIIIKCTYIDPFINKHFDRLYKVIAMHSVYTELKNIFSNFRSVMDDCCL